MGEIVESNGIAIDKRKVNNIIMKVIASEGINHRTKQKNDKEMVDTHMKIIEEEIHVYQED